MKRLPLRFLLIKTCTLLESYISNAWKFTAVEKHRIYVKLMLIDRKSISLGVAISPTVYLTRQLCIPDLVHKRYCPETYRSLAEP